jgi:hypothetical protein
MLFKMKGWYNMDYNEYKAEIRRIWSGSDKDNYMSKQRLNAYNGVMYSNFYYDVLKNRNGLVKNKFDKDTIKDVIFNEPATIIFWTDGSKTVVKCQDGDTYSKELGMAMCIIKKLSGNMGNYNDVFNKWIK